MIRLIKSELYKSWHDPLLQISGIIWFVAAIVINLFSSDQILGQLEIMSFLFPLLPCLVVGCTWAKEYNYQTIRYVLINQGNKIYIFISKFICSCANLFVIFTLYTFGLLLSGWSEFATSTKIVELYIAPILLLIAHMMILIMIANIFKSFSYLGLGTVIVFLFYYFCYKVANVYESTSNIIYTIAYYTFSSIYAYTYICPDIHTLIMRCIGFLFIGTVCLIVSFFLFIKTDL